MKVSRTQRHTVDIILFALIATLTSHQVTGDVLHEFLGIAALAATVIHIVFSHAWLRSLGTGRMGAKKVLMSVIDLALLASFAGTMVSGMAMSSYAVPVLYGIIPPVLARVLHLGCSSWLLVLAGLHLGLHIGPALKKAMRSESPWPGRVAAVLALAFAVFGLAAFAGSGISGYLTFSTHFATVDFTKPAVLAPLENMAQMWLFALISCGVTEALRAHGTRQRARSSQS